MSMQISFPGLAVVESRYHGFVVRTDQPGTNGAASSPSPFDLFLSSLGTCAGFYALRFCQQRQIPTADLGLRLDFERSDDGKAVVMVRITLELPAGFPAKYVDAIVRAVDQCAVKRNLLAPPRFAIEARLPAAAVSTAGSATSA